MTTPLTSRKTTPTASRSIPGWRPRDVRDFVKARAVGSRDVWQLDGQLIALNTGRILSNVAGVQEAILEKQMVKTTEPLPTPLRLPDGNTRDSHAPLTHAAKIIIRDSLFYTKTDGSKLQKFRFRPTSVARYVQPVLGRAGRITIGRTADELLVLARSRGEASVFTTVSSSPERVKGLLRTGWSFIGRRVQATNGISNPGVVEQFEFVADRNEGVWNWSGVGKCPSWYGRGQCAMHLSAKRVKWHDLDDNMKMWLREAGRSRLRIADADRAERDLKREREEEKKKRKKVLGLF